MENSYNSNRCPSVLRRAMSHPHSATPVARQPRPRDIAAGGRRRRGTATCVLPPREPSRRSVSLSLSGCRRNGGRRHTPDDWPIRLGLGRRRAVPCDEKRRRVKHGFGAIISCG
jgi:hypothetical protein